MKAESRPGEPCANDLVNYGGIAEAFLAAIIDSSDDAIVSKTLDGVITSWNQGAERLFGFSATEAVGQHITLIIPRERWAEETDVISRIRQGLSVDHFETVRRRKSGEFVDISLTVSPIKDAAGRIIGASKIARDITERKRVDAALDRERTLLQERERLLAREQQARSEAAALTHSAGLIASLDPDAVAQEIVTSVRVLLRCQASVCAMFDASGALVVKAVSGAVGSSWQPGATVPHSVGHVWQAIRERRATTMVNILEAPAMRWTPESQDGIEAVPYRAALAVPLMVEGRIIGVISVGDLLAREFRDEEIQLVSAFAAQAGLAYQNARLYQALESVNRTKDEFLAMLAHELRNPLNAVVNAVAALDHVSPSDLESARLHALIRRQTEHAARLLDDLLDVARIGQGRIALKMEPVDLREVVERATDEQRHLIETKRQQLNVARPDEPVTVVGDADRLQQVVGNLLNNASKYTPVSGSIWLSVVTDAGEAVVRVRDNGTGIPPDRLESIFEVFVQFNQMLASPGGGLGLGLALVKRLVELHGGAVHAHSQGPETGAEFVVRLPVAMGSREPTTAERNGPAAVRPARIVVIEDHDDSRDALVMALQLAGHDVHSASTGGEGVELVLREQPELVIIDVGLPDIDGFEVCRRLRREVGSDIRFIALTGYGQPADRKKSAEAGFDAHLVKPVTAQDILPSPDAGGRRDRASDQ
jgi:PAS domain S-box-containing protein